jgi:hypothetical protein
MLSVVVLSVVVLSFYYAECRYVECRCAEFHYTVCRYAECRCAECCGAVTTVSKIQVVGKMSVGQLVFDQKSRSQKQSSKATLVASTFYSFS